MKKSGLPDSLRELYPFTARVVAGNPYGIPVGKEFYCARRKAGASPYHVEVLSWGGNYRIYQFTNEEVILTPREDKQP